VSIAGGLASGWLVRRKEKALGIDADATFAGKIWSLAMHTEGFALTHSVMKANVSKDQVLSAIINAQSPEEVVAIVFAGVGGVLSLVDNVFVDKEKNVRRLMLPVWALGLSWWGFENAPEHLQPILAGGLVTAIANFLEVSLEMRLVGSGGVRQRSGVRERAAKRKGRFSRLSDKARPFRDRGKKAGEDDEPEESAAPGRRPAFSPSRGGGLSLDKPTANPAGNDQARQRAEGGSGDLPVVSTGRSTSVRRQVPQSTSSGQGTAALPPARTTVELTPVRRPVAAPKAQEPKRDTPLTLREIGLMEDQGERKAAFAEYERRNQGGGRPAVAQKPAEVRVVGETSEGTDVIEVESVTDESPEDSILGDGWI